MEIRQGWATEYGHAKFDVSVNEDDLARLCVENGISDAYRSRLTNGHAFILLDTLARWFSLREAVREAPSQDARTAALATATQAGEAHKEAIRRVKLALGVPEAANGQAAPAGAGH